MDIAVSLILGAMCGMGVGSAGLFVTYLVLSLGMEQLPAQGTNLAFFLCAAAASLPVHLKKRKLDTALIMKIALPAAAFSVLGSYIGTLIPGTALRKAFGFLLCAAGINAAVRCVREFLSSRKKKKSENIAKTLDK